MILFCKRIKARIFFMARIKEKVFYVTVFCVLGALLAVATFFDLQISSAIAALDGKNYYSQSLIAAVAECAGETAVYIFPSLSLCFIFELLGLKASASKKALRWLAVVLLFGLNYYAATRFISASQPYLGLKTILDGVLRFCFCALFSAAFSFLWLALAKAFAERLDEEELKNLAICSLIVIFTAISAEIVTHLFKPIFCRARYRYMLWSESNGVGAGFAEFSPWYEISIGRTVPEALSELVEKDAYHSFPSGHTTSSALVFSLTLLPFAVKSFNKKGWIIGLRIVAVSVHVLVAFARVLAGAHFLSDVTVATAITLACFLLFKNSVLKKACAKKD